MADHARIKSSSSNDLPLPLPVDQEREHLKAQLAEERMVREAAEQAEMAYHKQLVAVEARLSRLSTLIAKWLGTADSAEEAGAKGEAAAIREFAEDVTDCLQPSPEEPR